LLWLNKFRFLEYNLLFRPIRFREVTIFSLFFSCLMLGKAHRILLWPPYICNIKVVSKVHNVYFFSSSCQSKQSPDVTLKNLMINVGHDPVYLCFYDHNFTYVVRHFNFKNSVGFARTRLIFNAAVVCGDQVASWWYN
jgi:hypothetical protein